MPDVPQIFTDHPLSTDLIDPDAIKIVRRLRKFGYEAYLVGGCVRDLALGLEPKDFDVATSATPREVRTTFRNCRIIGRRFRLCHIFFQSKIIEVATFRTEPLSKLEEDAPEKVDQAAALAPPPPRVERRAMAPRPAPAAAPPPQAREPAPPPAPPLATLGGISDAEWRDFAAGILEIPAAPPVPGPPPAAAPAPALERRPPEDIAPWEADEEAQVREAAAIAGRRAVVREEVAEAAAEVEEAADEVDEELVEEMCSEIGGPVGGGGREHEREEREEEPERRGGERPRGGERRRPRWERIAEEAEPQAYGTAEEDARLRDFTINALFYDPVDDRIIDYVGGWADLRNRVLRTIGDAPKRMVEDPVRIVRAVKSAAKLDLEIDRATYDAMVSCARHLEECAPRRLVEEILKLLASGAAARCFRLLAEVGALAVMLPELAAFYPVDRPARGAPLSALPPSPGRPLAYRYLEALDRMPKSALTPSLLVAALFYAPIVERWAEAGLGRPGAPAPEVPEGRRGETALREARAEDIADSMLRDFASRHSLSKRTRAEATRVVLAQRLLRRPRGKRMRAAKLVSRDWFDAALALLRIAVSAEGADDEVCRSWEGRAAAVRAGEEEPLEDVPGARGGEAPRGEWTPPGLEEGAGGEEAGRGRGGRRRRGGRGRRRGRGERERPGERWSDPAAAETDRPPEPERDWEMPPPPEL
jgi:tRNA nucleotidyltransferase/poly(A) polymerase